MTGRVTTFYSYKGGSGRSMAMANAAWALATNGERVLAIDWDLEAPGLHRYFHPFLRDPEQMASSGLIDRIWDYVSALSTHASKDSAERYALAECGDLVQKLDLPIRSKGCLHFLGAGRQDEHYSDKVGGLDWSNFYARFGGGTFVERMMDWARGQYSHILIDSRTGVADTAGICTAQIPDNVVMCFVYNRQSIEGTAAIARSVRKMRRASKRKALNLHVLACRVEDRGEVDSARRYAAGRIAQALETRSVVLERQLRREEIRHYPWCAFEEKLAVFEDVPEERGSLLDAMHELSRRVSGRDDLKIAPIAPSILEQYWRRAAFADPRLADLEAIAESPFDSAYQRLLYWLDETLDTVDERPEWLMALAEALIGFIARSEEHIGPSQTAFLGDAALRLGRRAIENDRSQYRVPFALLLQRRAGQLQRLGLLDEALQHVQAASALFLEDRSPVAHWRHARAVERVAEIHEAKGDSAAALKAYRAAAKAYGELDTRHMPTGVALDPARSLRLLAERLLAQGETIEAERVAETATRQLRRIREYTSKDEVAEVINVLVTRAEIAAYIDASTGGAEIAKVRALADELLASSDMRMLLDRRLCLIEAKLLSRRGYFEKALELLRSLPASVIGAEVDQTLLATEADILLSAGHDGEALDLLLTALDEHKVPLSSELVEPLERALAANGRSSEMLDILIMQLLSNRMSVPAETLARYLPSESGRTPGEKGRTGQLVQALQVKNRIRSPKK